MTINEFFGTLQESVTDTWRKHLQTNKYSTHMALDEYYTEMPEKVDALIEAWQSENDIVEDYTCILKAEDYDAVGYLEELKKIVKEGRSLMNSSELESLCDDCLSQIDSTLYKLKHLKECKTLTSLVDFLTEQSVLNGGAEQAADNAVLVASINDTRKPKGGKPTVDTWGNPVKLGDYVLGVSKGWPKTKNCIDYQSDSNLVAGKVVDIYNGGLEVVVSSVANFDPEKCHSSNLEFYTKNFEENGGVTLSLKTKCGFIKVDPRTLQQLFHI